MHHFGYWDGAYGGGWMIVHGAFWILLVAAIVAGTIFLLRLAGRGSRGEDADGQSALEILDRRYAQGEIDREDYLQRKLDLTGGQGGSGGGKN